MPAGTAPTATGRRFVDLHMHSTASDGALVPAAVVRAAAAADLAAIALTDHDTLAGVAQARDEGERLGVRVIAGVELSATEDGQETHLLGLHLVRVEELDRHLVGFRDARRVRAEHIVERLNALGIPITMAAIEGQAAGGAIGRPHVARALVLGGWVADHRDAFDRYLGAGRPGYVGKPRLEIAEAIRLVHEAGGIAVLAHPGAECTRQRLEQLAGLGLDGIEVKHPSHSPAGIVRLERITEELGLVPSGGSDWHGAAAGPRVIGCMQVELEWLERQEARVDALRSKEPVG